MRFYFILGTVVIGCVAIIAAATTGCAGKAESERVTAVIQGASMAPAFLGKHHLIKCKDCGIRFPVDAELVPNHSLATCPNCGFMENSIHQDSVADSTPIEVQVPFDEAKRWDPVAFELNDSPRKGIKRLVGFPGESVSISAGDVWIDGVIAGRTRETQQQMRVLNFDSQHLAHSEDAPSRIVAVENRFEFHSDAWVLHDASNPVSGFLAYQPVNCYRGIENRKPTKFIQDNYGYNQAISRPTMNDVDQLEVVLHLHRQGSGELSVWIRFHQHLAEFRFLFDEGKVMLFYKGVLIKTEDWKVPESQFKLSTSTFDGMAVACCGEQLLLEQTLFDLDSHTDEGQAQTPVGMKGVPIGISARLDHGNIALKRIQIYRDIYYTSDGQLEFELGEGEYLLLGDNSPVSVDSRHWKIPIVGHHQIVGIVRRSDESEGGKQDD